MTDPDLTDDEIDRICDGLTQNAAKVRYLKSLGVDVKRKPSGRPLVNRAHYNAVRSGAGIAGAPGVSSGPQPNWTRPA